MSNWSLTKPPEWVPDAIATESGWKDPVTGELLVAIRGLNVKNAGPQIQKVTRIGNITRYGRSTTLSFRVKYNEVVVVTGTPRIPLTIGAASNLFLTYASGTGSSSLVFSYAIQNSDTGAVSIAGPVDLNGGTIVDSLATNALLTFTVPNTSTLVVDTALPTTTSIANISPTSYVTGNSVNFNVTFSKAVEVVGTPLLELTLNGSVAAVASYVSGTGTSVLTFVHTVGALAVNATGLTMTAQDIDFNGGTIKDLAGNTVVDITFTGPANIAAVSFNSTATPSIVSVASTSGSGTYSAALGSILSFTVQTSKIVEVVGSPRLTLAINGVGKNATYVSGSGTDSLLFQYTVVSGDSAAATEFDVSSPLVLNGGTIKDVLGTNLNSLTFTPPNTDGIVIDNAGPTAPTMAFVNGAGAYNAGDVFTFTATYADTGVVVTNSPRLAFTINGVQRYALFTGVASGVVTFAYTVVQADSATSGQIVVSSPIDLNGGTIRDAVNNGAVLTFTPPSMSGVVIDNTAPQFSTVTGPSGGPNFKLADTLTMTATFTEVVNVIGTPRIALDVNGTTRFANYASGTGTNTLTFTYAVQSTDNAQPGTFNLISPFQLNGGTIRDAAGNDLSPLTFNLPNNSSTRVDGVVPAAPTVVISGDTANAFVTGNVLTLTATYAEAIAVTGTPRIAVVIGGNTRQANYASGTGTNALVFTYTIVGGDAATAGNMSVTSPISLNGGTIRDLATNNATLTFAAPAGIALKTAN